MSLPPIDDTEKLQRFILDRKLIKADRIMPNAFLPQPCYPNELSVYRTINFSQNELWQIGDEYVGKAHKEPRTVKASGELIASNVKQIFNETNATYLELKALETPHPNHTNIENVATSSPTDLLIAEKLVKIAERIKRNS